MKLGFKTASLLLAGCGLALQLCFAQESHSNTFSGSVNSDNINIRADSNITSKIISTISKGVVVEVIAEKYDWYKIKLPKTSSAFTKKNFFFPIDEKTAKASSDNINIRMEPNESSPILGKIKINEVIAVLEDKGGWYKIEPNDNSFGWINKKFVNKASGPVKAQAKQAKTEIPVSKIKETVQKTEPKDNNIFVEGIIQPYGKVVNRIATHKLITKDYKVFFLKGNINNLNSFSYHKVKISGRLAPLSKEKYPLIEIIKMEALD